jgi:hypothetical protein
VYQVRAENLNVAANSILLAGVCCWLVECPLHNHVEKLPEELQNPKTKAAATKEHPPFDKLSQNQQPNQAPPSPKRKTNTMASEDEKKKEEEEVIKEVDEAAVAVTAAATEKTEEEEPLTPSNKRRFFPRVKHLLTREWESVSIFCLCHGIGCHVLSLIVTLTWLLFFLLLLCFSYTLHITN